MIYWNGTQTWETNIIDISNYATQNYVTNQLNAKITYGTSDLTPGTSTLNEGVVYFVYET